MCLISPDFLEEWPNQQTQYYQQFLKMLMSAIKYIISSLYLSLLTVKLSNTSSVAVLNI